MSLYKGSALDSQTVGPRPFKSCGCGETYTAEQWAKLGLLGLQSIDADAFGEAMTLEVRECKFCGSTLAIEARND